ncbi:LUD domain-containing protein [Terrabacter sp. NPDC000476]|uniref:LutC/YkgG family protein n=1 Tax=Terrabacter sp. NPDC000476 TaxID=3154258 RepID=UPI0033336D9F
MSARDEILARVRSAVADVTTEPATPAPPGGLGAGTLPAVDAGGSGSGSGSGRLPLFVERVADYRATVLHARPGEVGAVVAAALRDAGCRSVVVPTGLDDTWLEGLAGDVSVLGEAQAPSHVELDGVDAVVTGAKVGVALTGTIVLDHSPGQGRRELTLVPDTHVCVVHDDDVVHDVPDAVARLRPDPAGARPLTWISGPSATSDIELQRVEGVHGPRTLVVVLVSATDVDVPAPAGGAA